MNVEQLTEQLYNNLNKLVSPENYKNIINRANNLSSFDVINRLLIEMQNSNSFEIRTEEDWELNGRKVRKKAKPIYILMPKYSYRYKDKNTGEIIVNTDLNSNEISKALDYNLIEKIEILDDLYCIEMYDIRETIGVKDNYKVTKPKLSVKDTLELFSKITGATIEKCEESYYSKSSNTLFICNNKYKDFIANISKYLTHYYMYNVVEEILNNTFNTSISEFSEYDKQILEDSIQYSISTLLGVDIKISFDELKHISNDKIVVILNVTDNIIFGIAHHLSFNTEYKFKDTISNVTLLRKSEAILNILEANSILNKMKGA